MHASKCTQKMSKATVRDAMLLNKVANKTKETKDRGLVFRRSIIDVKTAKIISYTTR